MLSMKQNRMEGNWSRIPLSPLLLSHIRSLRFQVPSRAKRDVSRSLHISSTVELISGILYATEPHSFPPLSNMVWLASKTVGSHDVINGS